MELVRADAIAFRAAITAGFVGFLKTLPASPAEGFNPAVVELEVPEGIQFFCISVLLLVFALAINTDADSEEKSGVELVKADAIAFRCAVFSGIVGVFKTFATPDARAEFASMNQTEFAPDVAMLEAPEGLQLLCVALLLFVFVAAVNSEDAMNQKAQATAKQTMLELVRPQTIAFRMAMVAALIGSLMTIDSGIVSLPRIAATGEIALVLGTGIAVMVSDVPRQLVSV